MSQNVNELDAFLLGLDNREISILGEQIALALGITIPITKMELILTQQCTCRCDYCFMRDKSEEVDMITPTGRAAIDFLVSFSGEIERLSITFFGGEPLMRLSLIKDLVEYCSEVKLNSKKQIAYSLTTNGLLIDEQNMDYFQNNSIKLLLSIDGDRKTHNAHRKLADGSPTFDLIFPKIALMKKYQPWLGARLTVHPDTTNDLFENIKFLHQSGINQFIIGPNMLAHWNEAEYEAFEQQQQAVANYYIQQHINGNNPLRLTEFEKGLEEIKQNVAKAWGCEAGRDKIAVSGNGDIFPCSKFIGLDPNMRSYKMGDLFQGLKNYPIRAELCDNRRNIRGSCISCDYGDYCSGGCPPENLSICKSIFMPNETQCRFTRMRIELFKRNPDLSNAHKIYKSESPHIRPF